MVATVRLDTELSQTLDDLVSIVKKKKSDIIREAIKMYAQNLENSKKSRLRKAIDKSLKADFQEHQDMEDSLNDGL
jgi:predicted transcriptional regulator